MFKIKNFMENKNIITTETAGAFRVIEYIRDLSVTQETAQTAYFSSKMNVRKRQVVCNLNISGITTQAGAMQWKVGNSESTSGIKGVGDLLGKTVKSKLTGDTIVKPEYVGQGIVMLEPTYKYILLEDLNNWNGSMVIEDGMFLACHSNIKQAIQFRKTLSSATNGGEGLANLSLIGNGIVCLKSNYPREELVEIYLENDVLKIDGNLAVAWSSSLNFTVEKSGKTLIGSMISGEGLVNVYRGTGKVLLAPVS